MFEFRKHMSRTTCSPDLFIMAFRNEHICNCLFLHDIFDKHGVGVVVLVVSFAAVVLVLPASFVDVC